MGLVGNRSLLDWFQAEYAKQVPTKLNMGKSCLRLTNPKKIPYILLGELMEKMTVDEWITRYTCYQEKKSGQS